MNIFTESKNLFVKDEEEKSETGELSVQRTCLANANAKNGVQVPRAYTKSSTVAHSKRKVVTGHGSAHGPPGLTYTAAEQGPLLSKWKVRIIPKVVF